MAAAAPRHPDNASSAARGIYRFLGNSHFVWGDLLKPLYRKAKSLFAQEKQVLGIIDLSPVEKPYARKMKGLCRVRRNDGSGTTNGYMSISTILHWAGKTGLGYFKLFSHQCELMSQNQEIDSAMSGVRRLLSGRTKIIWVWDRGFDDKKAFGEFMGEEGDEFIVRAYQNRLIKVNGEERKLLEYVRGLEYCLTFDTELKIKRRRRKVKIDLSIGSFECAGMKLWVVRSVVRGFKEEWILITNVPVTDLDTALEIWRNYARRWGIEDFYKFSKNNLNLEAFQVDELEKIRKVLSWVAVAGAFLYDLGVDINDPHIKLLLRLGGFAGRKRDKPGKGTLERGLSRLFIAMMVNENLENNSS
jgi:hypothetical protein